MTPLAGSLVTAETTAASFDTKLAVVTDGCGTQTCVTGNDDGGSGTLSRVQWVADGSTYLIAVTGFGSSTGTFTLEVTTPRENDNLCGTPTAIGNPSGSIAGATSCATVDTPTTSCGTGLGSSADVWYDYAASSTECRLVTFDTCTNSYDTKLAAFTGGCGTLGCITGLEPFFRNRRAVLRPSSPRLLAAQLLYSRFVLFRSLLQLHSSIKTAIQIYIYIHIGPRMMTASR